MPEDSTEKQKPDQFSNLNFYGDREVFEKREEEGYSQVNFGRGPWIKGERVVGMFAFYHPDGKISILMTPKHDISGETIHGRRTEREFENEEEFKKFVEQWKIELAERSDLGKFLNKWEK